MQIQNKIFSVIGKRGYGKTTLTDKLMISLNKPTIICDPRFQYNSDQKRRIHFKSVSSLNSWLVKHYDAFKYFKFELVVNVFPDTFEEFLELVNKMKKITLVIDEVDMFADARLKRDSELYKLIHYGRHHEIDIITTSRRPANIPRDLTSQTDEFYFSRLTEPNDKKYIKDLYGNSYVDIVKSLPKFEFLRCIDEDTFRMKTTEKEMEILNK